jgi:hypothetical protein
MIPSNYLINENEDNSYSTSYNSIANNSSANVFNNSIGSARKSQNRNVFTSLKPASDLNDSASLVNDSYNVNLNSDYEPNVLAATQSDTNNNKINGDEKFRTLTSSKLIESKNRVLDQDDQDDNDDKLIDLNNDDYYINDDDTKVIIAKSLNC